MDSSTVNTVFLGFIIVAVVIFFITIFKTNKITNIKRPIDSEDNDETIDDSQLPTKRPKKKVKFSKPLKYCDLNKLETPDISLVRDIVIGKKYQQPQKECSFSDKEIKNYQNQVFSAEDNFNYSSKNAITPNDRLNEIFVKNGNELNSEQGKTIGDVFDGLMKNDFEIMKKNVGDEFPEGSASNFTNAHQWQTL
jgi:hypothetical protein